MRNIFTSNSSTLQRLRIHLIEVHFVQSFMAVIRPSTNQAHWLGGYQMACIETIRGHLHGSKGPEQTQ